MKKLILLSTLLITLVSCGNPYWESPQHEPYFQGEWRRNDTTLSNGSKFTQNATEFLMPNTLEVDASMVITVPLADTVQDCYSGRVLSKDGQRYLDFNHYEVLDCYENIDNDREIDIVIRFNRTRAEAVYFDYM